MKVLIAWTLALVLGLYFAGQIADSIVTALNAPAVAEYTNVVDAREAIADCVDMGFSATVETLFDNGNTVDATVIGPLAASEVGRPVSWTVRCYKPLGV